MASTDPNAQASQAAPAKRPGRVSHQGSVIVRQEKPTEFSHDTDVRVDDYINDAIPITKEQAAIFLKELKKQQSNEQKIQYIKDNKTQFLFTSQMLLDFLDITPSVKTKIEFINLIGPRLTDPGALADEILERFRYMEEKDRVRAILNKRSSLIKKRDSLHGGGVAILMGAGRGGRGGRGRGGRGGVTSPSPPPKVTETTTDSTDIEPTSLPDVHEEPVVGYDHGASDSNGSGHEEQQSSPAHEEDEEEHHEHSDEDISGSCQSHTPSFHLTSRPLSTEDVHLKENDNISAANIFFAKVDDQLHEHEHGHAEAKPAGREPQGSPCSCCEHEEKADEHNHKEEHHDHSGGEHHHKAEGGCCAHDGKEEHHAHDHSGGEHHHKAEGGCCAHDHDHQRGEGSHDHAHNGHGHEHSHEIAAKEVISREPQDNPCSCCEDDEPAAAAKEPANKEPHDIPCSCCDHEEGDAHVKAVEPPASTAAAPATQKVPSQEPAPAATPAPAPLKQTPSAGTESTQSKPATTPAAPAQGCCIIQ